LIKGITDDIFNKVKGSLTVYGDGAVNINTADAIVLRGIGMTEELAAKIVHFRGESDNMTAANVFDNAAKITALLDKAESISGDENGKIGSLIASGRLSVISNNFSGQAAGNVGDKTRPDAARIAFVFDRKNNVIRYWRE
ncbi:MAG: type II secretion system protein GspK, partial [Candidatus Omnitrophica bacterium]|nr:type II secretion system protein GspK [Candidatus Omnitrophota bacterium]